MKLVFSFLSMLWMISFAEGKERSFTGSTPAGPVVKSFLGIPLADSVDFIRWKLVLEDNQYRLSCHYGIGKPNTNGFINGGKKLELKGELKKEKNIYKLRNAGRVLSIAELNQDLLHFLGPENRLLIGNGGWSYTINNISPNPSNKVNLNAKPTAIKDSLALQGRTPCGVPGIIPAGTHCYKLKWYIVLYPNAEKNNSGRYRLLGTGWRAEGGLRGTWNRHSSSEGHITYQLNDEHGKAFIYLLKLDENVLAFTDAQGKLLVGNEDFSYALNRAK
jgi:hypothetical protein